MSKSISVQEIKIADILNQRQPFAQEIQSKRNNLRQQLQALKALEIQYLRIERQGPMEMFNLLQHIPIRQLIKEIEIVDKELAKPERRFTRSTLNIGVVGRAGQGKSTLLQKLSGVGPEAIPTGNRGFCTGVRSVIRHSPDPSQKGGLISFYGQEEFLQEVLAPYYHRLDLGNSPESLERFVRSPLPPPVRRDALSRAMYQHLESYKQYASIYIKSLGASDLPVPIDKVRQYVAQDSLDGNSRYYEFMAVEQATITTPFHQKDVGRVALVDMPGLGDTGVGDDERLMQALGEEIDVALFVLMPHMRAELQDYDFQLYDLAHDAMGGTIPIEDWSFMVLNHNTRGDDNRTRCEDIKAKIDGERAGHGNHPMKVVQCIVADCSDPTAASALILTPVLEYLAREMNSLDGRYMAAWRTKLCNVQKKIEQVLKQASQVLNDKASEQRDDWAFEERFKRHLWPELATASIALVEELKRENANPNAQFAVRLQKIIDNCQKDQGLPSLEEIAKRSGSYGAPINAFNDYLHVIRTHLTRHFMDIDDHTNFTMDEIKAKVAHLFLSVGCLSSLFPNLNDKKELFAVMAAQGELAEPLRKTFYTLGAYQLSLRGYFLSRIRGGDVLTKLSPFYGTPVPPDSLSAQGIREKLDELQKAAVRTIWERLRNAVVIPSEAACALGEEFIDQTLRSKDAEGHWRLFYRAHRAKIWPEVFEESTRWNALQQSWQNACQNAQRTLHSAPICTPA